MNDILQSLKQLHADKRAEAAKLMREMYKIQKAIRILEPPIVYQMTAEDFLRLATERMSDRDCL